MVRRRAGDPAVGEQIGRLIGLDVELGKRDARGELPAGDEALGQFEVVANVEKLDRVLVVFGEFHKRMGS